jgi:hypothetical protein
VGITLRPLLAPSTGRVAGALWGLLAGVLAAVVASGWVSVTLLPDVVVDAIPIPVAVGIGWLFGPLAVRGDRWTAAGAAVAAAILGTITGAFVAAGVAAPLWTNSLPAAIGYTLSFGVIALAFAGIPALVIALPVTLLFTFLTRRTARAWERRAPGTRATRQTP